MALHRQRRPKRKYLPVSFYGVLPEKGGGMPPVIRVKASIVVQSINMTKEQRDKAYPLSKRVRAARAERDVAIKRMKGTLTHGVEPSAMCRHMYGETCPSCNVYTPYPRHMRSNNDA